VWPNNLQVGLGGGGFLESRHGKKPYTDFSADPEAYKVAFQTMMTLTPEMGHQKSKLTLSPI
jgi:hypothetical protein